MAALAGLAAALLFLWMPVGLVEMVVASSGISEALPAAAPPLGLKARLMMAGFAGLMAVGVVGLARRDTGVPALERFPGDRSRSLFRKSRQTKDLERRSDSLRSKAAPEDGKGRAHRVQGARKMGFAFSKLTALARGRALPDAEQEAPVLRRADAHPDAPSRPPIFASRDFDGLDIFPRGESGRRALVANRDSGADSVVPLGSLAMPSAPTPLADAELPQPAFLRPAGPFATPTLVRNDMELDSDDEPAAAPEPVQAAEPAWAPPPMAPFETLIAASQPAPISMPEPAADAVRPAPLPLPSTHGLSITELTDRLERGLMHRSRTIVPSAAGGVIADMPVASAVPVRAAVEQDADEALRAALGTLRAMAGRR